MILGGEKRLSTYEPTGEWSPPARTFTHKYGFCINGGVRMKDGLQSLIGIVKTLTLPIIVYVTFVSAVFLGIGLSSSITITSVLLAAPYNWPFDKLGLVIITSFVASVFVMFIGGTLSDRLVSFISKRNGGRREAEYNLWNMVLPFFMGIVGCMLFGVGGEYVNRVHWMAIIAGTTMLTFTYQALNSITSVVAIESYPRLAG